MDSVKTHFNFEILDKQNNLQACRLLDQLWKYILELLSTADFLGSKHSSIPKDTSVKFSKDKGIPLYDPSSCRKLLGKLMYVDITRPDILYDVNTLCQFSNDP